MREHPDRVIARIARLQRGLTTYEQLLAAGLSPGQIARRIRSGKLIPVHIGVYAVGHDALTLEARFLAGVLAAGPGAALGHRSAARHLALRATHGSVVEVIGTRNRKGNRNLIVHRPRTIHPEDVTVVEGIPTTTAARTLLDLAATVDKRALEEAVRQAYFLRLVTDASLNATIGRSFGHHGIRRLREAALLPAGERLRNRAEQRLLGLIIESRLPKPRVNFRVLGRERDLVWLEQRLVVEFDGWEAHGHRIAFEDDRERDGALAEQGWTTLRFTWRQLDEHPEQIVARIGTVLTRLQKAA